MRVTFLVGNGFDRAVGLATGYDDFYKWYCKKKSDSEVIEEFKQEIQKYLISLLQESDTESEEVKLWSDLEYGLGQCTEKLFKNRIPDFLECYEDIHNAMNRYIDIQNQTFDLENIPEKQVEKLRKGLNNFYEELSPAEKQTIKKQFERKINENCEIRLLTFNYTDTLEACAREMNKAPVRSWDYGGSKLSMTVNPNVLHVHGRIDFYPIMGVNDESQIANKEFLKNEDVLDNLIKPASVNAIGELWHQEAESAIMASDIICIFGMSLGCTDAKWWALVMNWLKQNVNHHLIVFWYSNTISGTVSILNKRREERNVKKRLQIYLEEHEKNNANILSRIHIIMNTKKVLQCELTHVEKESNLDNFIDKSTSLSVVL